ncbi:MAG: tRNA lysidine(34) synthetase TilS [Helicobacteraceae bacterium]
MIDGALLADLKTSKNLLAFSHGLDSTALFYLLERAGVEFDVITVNYGVRLEAQAECSAIKALANRFGKRLFLKNAPAWSKNFEKNARDFRYAFFKETATKHGYDAILTAHQLNDRFEWFLMQLSRGAGLAELVGMRAVQDLGGIKLVRPLLNVPRSVLEKYLRQINAAWFYDESNADESYTRNYFRKNFSDKFLSEFAGGVQKSFAYLAQDAAGLGAPVFKERRGLYIVKRKGSLSDARLADFIFKRLGVVLSAKQRAEIAQNESLVVSRKYALSKTPGYMFIHAYKKFDKIPKLYREKCRVLRLPVKLRPFLYINNFNIDAYRTIDDLYD